jgi:hypothetical protein
MNHELFVKVANTFAVIGCTVIAAGLFLVGAFVLKCARHGRRN